MIRILLNNNIRANLTGIFGDATEGYLDQGNTFVQESLGGGKGKSDLDAIKASFDALTGSELLRIRRRPAEGAVARSGRAA